MCLLPRGGARAPLSAADPAAMDHRSLDRDPLPNLSGTGRGEGDFYTSDADQDGQINRLECIKYL